MTPMITLMFLAGLALMLGMLLGIGAMSAEFTLPHDPARDRRWFIGSVIAFALQAVLWAAAGHLMGGL